MKELLTVCLLSLSLSTSALATEEVQSGTDWLTEQGTPKVLTISEQNMAMPLFAQAGTTSTELINEDNIIKITEGGDFQEALSLGIQMIEAINLGKFQLALGALLMMLIWGLRTFWKSLPGAALPWIGAGIAIVGSTAVGLLSGWPWERILVDALTVSTSAGGLWSLIGKHISNIGK